MYVRHMLSLSSKYVCIDVSLDEVMGALHAMVTHMGTMLNGGEREIRDFIVSTMPSSHRDTIRLLWGRNF